MTVENVYRCNLCNHVSPLHEVLGLRWIGPTSKAKGNWTQISPEATEAHLCYRCATSAKKMMEEVFREANVPGPPDPPRPLKNIEVG